MSDLLNRIDKALAAESQLSSVELNNLLVEIDTAIATAAEERADYLNASIPASDEEEQRVTAMTLRKNRMIGSIPKLQSKIATAENRERTTVYHEDIDELRPENDQLVDILIAGQQAIYNYANVLIRLQNHRQKLNEVHARAPSGVSLRLPDPELIARRQDCFHAGFKPLYESVRLVDFITNEQIIPVRDTSMSTSVLSLSRAGDSIRYSDQWSVAAAEENERQRQAAAKRLADQRAVDEEDARQFNSRAAYTRNTA